MEKQEIEEITKLTLSFLKHKTYEEAKKNTKVEDYDKIISSIYKLEDFKQIREQTTKGCFDAFLKLVTPKAPAQIHPNMVDTLVFWVILNNFEDFCKKQDEIEEKFRAKIKNESINSFKIPMLHQMSIV